ncbi:acyl-CoA N-acyltransferase [Lentinula aff. detonsa]|uniref:Acyl-CoA N-acyltransferase n=1 Tax=Lentinula aff. detonsa TaxID=2804958 RepID=A0AA38NCT9_9AGAR|nr:acyl-CoA N-acyltransferase [Lentinula aff. detonsa]
MDMLDMNTLKFDLVKADQLERAIELELDGYPAEEAASFESFRLRQSQAPELFFGAFKLKQGLSPDACSSNINLELIAYICGTRSSASHLTHSSMIQHVPDGSSVCIHSVCVSKEYRRQGVALALLTEYVQRLQLQRRISVQDDSETKLEIERILLITHEELIPLYAKAGFELVGESSVKHGERVWYEMMLNLS